MQTRMIRDLEVPVVGMGSAGSFDVPMSELEVRKQILDNCISQGSNFVDTSPMYRRSEQVIGAAMEGKRDKFQLATKVWCTGRDTAVRQMARSYRTAQDGLYRGYADSQPGGLEDSSAPAGGDEGRREDRRHRPHTLLTQRSDGDG